MNEQLTHNHKIGENTVADDDTFVVCGCTWCKICDNPPHECICDMDKNPHTIAALTESNRELREALEKITKKYHEKTRYHDEEYGIYHDCDFSECTAPICENARAILEQTK